MAENFRALVAIFAMAIPTFWWMRVPLTSHAIDPSDFRLRTRLWFGLTTALFLVQSFWLFVIVVALAVLAARSKDSNPVGLYFFLLLLAPPFQAVLPGFAGINQFLAIDYLRVLSLAILLPSALVLVRQDETPRYFKLPTDKYVFGYLVLLLAIQAPITSTTNLARGFVSLFIDAFLPYYVFSRGLYDLRRMRDALASFAGVCVVLAVIAIFEFFKGWLLYSSLPSFLGVTWGFGGYMMRDNALRANATMGHSIILGYGMTVALGLHIAVRSSYPTMRRWLAVSLVLAGGIAASISRGPWVGATVMVIVAICMGPGKAGRLAKLVMLSIVGLPLLALTSMGERLVALLPFVGTVQADSVEYRQQLFEVSWNVLMMNPVFGSPYYMSNSSMEQLRQGEGIIDMVNSYMGIALLSGFVGLTLFVAAFASSGVRVWLHVARNGQADDEEVVIGRGLLATLVGVLVTIATASSVDSVPVIYWCLAGALAAYMWQVNGEVHMPVPSAARHNATNTSSPRVLGS